MFGWFELVSHYLVLYTCLRQGLRFKDEEEGYQGYQHSYDDWESEQHCFEIFFRVIINLTLVIRLEILIFTRIFIDGIKFYWKLPHLPLQHWWILSSWPWDHECSALQSLERPCRACRCHLGRLSWFEIWWRSRLFLQMPLGQQWWICVLFDCSLCS